MSSRGVLVALAVAVSLLVRLLPAAAAGWYYSTDVWPLIRSAERMVRNPNLRFWDHSELGGYHNRWPAAIISGAVYSRVTGLDPAAFFRYVGVAAVSACLVLSVYTVAARASSPRRALACSLVLSTVPSFVVFTAAVLKEVYSYPVAAALLLAAPRGTRGTVLISASVLSVALATSHPLTPAILASFVASRALTRLVGDRRPRAGWVPLSRLCLVFALITVAYVAYGASYGWEGLRYRLELRDLAALAAIASAVYGWYALSGGSGVGCSLLLVPTTLAAAALSVTGAVRAYAVPYALAPALLLVTLLLKRGDSTLSSAPASMLLPVTTATLFTLLAQPSLVPVVHRVLNHVVWAAALAPALARPGSRLAALLQAAALAVGLGVSVVALTVGDPVTYYWIYREAEVSALKLVPLLPTRICGDAKVRHLVELELEVDAVCGVEVLRGLSKAMPLVLYADNLRYGYVLSPIDIYPVGDLGRLGGRLNLLYSNPHLLVWW